MAYLHGAYGRIVASGTRAAAISRRNAIVYVGTAPVHHLPEYAGVVNQPVLINNMAEAKEKLGWSDDWASYTLCEAMHAHFELCGVAPLVFINVLNPAVDKKQSGGTGSFTPSGGVITITSAEDIILKSVSVPDKTLGTDYTSAYDPKKKVIILEEITAGALGSSALTITWDIVDPSAVSASDVVGTSDGEGVNTGLACVKNVYQATGYIPSFLAAPGFSSNPTVHAGMLANSSKVNGHWDLYLFCDIPILNSGSAMTFAGAATWKETNGYNKDNESVYFPMARGTDGNLYHLSVLALANFHQLLVENEGIPFMTASNTDCPIIQNLYLGSGTENRVYDDTLINEKLNKNGISSACFVGGRFAIWGAHSASYSQSNADQINVAETNRMMLFYISNDFQDRRPPDVDKPMTRNDLNSIVAEERARLDALIRVGALTFAEVYVNATAEAKADIVNGDYSFVFNITTTPLAKSLTAVVNWTDEGYVTYFEDYD